MNNKANKTSFKKGHPLIGKGIKGYWENGGKAWNKGIKKQLNSGRTNFQKGHIPFNKGKRMPEEIRKKQSGENSHFWKGGVTPINIKIRMSIEYKLWRKSCFERDNFTCQKYGIRGGKLVAHHINNFADFPELRLALDNGITLSEKAHKEFHKIYGKKNNTKEQLNEFLNSK